MPPVSASWYADPDALLGELRRQRHDRNSTPSIPGFDELVELQRGGQGVVYTAMQSVPRRRVAIKVMREHAFASANARRRFEREIDLLAGLRHPNIVSVYDGGTTDDGRLFLVMELVEGKPLDAFVRARMPEGRGPVAPDALLPLFAKVCDAIQSAHRRGVIHRDLKPSNILVDAQGEPHIVDFGLAKAVGEDRPASGMTITGTAHFLGSLPWASPEQAEGESDAIDVRTDVYSLGVILYQLLAGRFPYDVRGKFREVLDRIVNVEPSRPSTGQTGVDDDLDTIVLKCLAKDPARRYQSAGELARDIRHYLAGEPIEARRDSAWYTLRRTARRYRVALTVSGAFIVAVVCFAIAMTFLYGKATRAEALAQTRLGEVAAARDSAEREADKARRANAFLKEMLSAAAPSRQGREVRVVDLLNQAAAQLRRSPPLDPTTHADLLAELGSTYLGLGLADAAQKALLEALDIRRRTVGAEHADALETERMLSDAEAALGDLQGAEARLRKLVEVESRVLGSEDERTLWSRNYHGQLLWRLGRIDEAATLLTASLATCRRSQGDQAEVTMGTANSLAVVHRAQGKWADAEAIYRRNLAVLDGTGRRHDPLRLTVQFNLSAVLTALGHGDEALSMLRENLADRQHLYGDDHPETTIALDSLAKVLGERGRREEAEPIARKALDASKRRLGPEHPDTLLSMNNLGILLQNMHKYEEAEPLLRQALELRRKVLGREHPDTLVSMANLAGLLQRRGAKDESIALGREALAIRRRVLGEDRLDTLISMNNLGLQLQEQGYTDEAESLLKQAAVGSARILPKGHWIAAAFLANHGTALTALNRYEEAEAELTRAHEAMSAALGPSEARTVQAIDKLIDLYTSWGRAAQAEEWKARKAEAARATAAPPTTSASSAPTSAPTSRPD